MEGPPTFDITLGEYNSAFVQRFPKYIVKRIGGKNWTTRRRGLTDGQIREHLRGKKAIGCIGKWYPGHVILDLDNKDERFLDELKEKLGLNGGNSFTCTSESPDSYHVLLRPIYRQKPPTLKLLNDVMQPFAKTQGVEVYPQSEKGCRLPFGPLQKILNEGAEWESEWRQKLYWFNKLDEYDISKVPQVQDEIELDYPQSKGRIGTYTTGREWYEHGLQGPSTRAEAQFAILYYLWRRNVPLETAVSETWRWIRTKHNGFSRDIIAQPREVKRHIERQAKRIYSTYILPDEAHNTYCGFITRNDIPDILRYSAGSWVKARFLYHLVKYCYPRRLRDKISVHSDHLVEWSSWRTYQVRLRELKELDLVERGQKYIVGLRSKAIVLNWKYKNPEGALLHDERAPDTLEENLSLSLKPEETKALLKRSGFNTRSVITRSLQYIYNPIIPG